MEKQYTIKICFICGEYISFSVEFRGRNVAGLFENIQHAHSEHMGPGLRIRILSDPLFLTDPDPVSDIDNV